MKKILSITAITTLAALGLTGIANACTVATHDFKPYGTFASRNFDVCLAVQSQFTVYPRNLEFTGATPEETKNTVNWKNKYGYVVIEETNWGNVASEGLNEKGLAAHILYNGKETTVKIDPNKPTINSIKWLHYILGNFSNVNEVLDSIKKYNLHNYPVSVNGKKVKLPIHYKIEDSSGDSAIIEFSDGKVYTYHNPSYTVMANEPNYDEQIQNLLKLSANGKKYSIDNLPGGANSLNRFARTFYSTTILPDTSESQNNAIRDMYSIMNMASVPFNNLECSLAAMIEGKSNQNPEDTWPTVWTSASDLSGKKLYYSSVAVGNRVWVDLNKVDLDKGQKPISVNLEDHSLVGDISDKLK
ncbi:linear amide C-N hydrolase [Francisella frigiditurris]|uniref:Linear amide C-N hydrolase, choloylglycine hydrolase family protein n=1 Tax=Francisella frigiditurris TaxID=1542390 RepID=A0A1J0KRH1_9GAMM|nr:linear amide C-N hydrolase [Francisella frigiditurris]APC96212.1 linear amide C-N hydrolase, choloylglycine hydrolase family protein [Francisella frigiditurris]